MSFQTLISAEELSNHLHQQDWVLVDCRFELADPGWGEEEYRILLFQVQYSHTDPFCWIKIFDMWDATLYLNPKNFVRPCRVLELAYFSGDRL
jgi:hypothetical protein